MIVTVRLSGGRVSVPVVKENILTVLVALTDGNIIKRHRRKHGVIESSGPEAVRKETWWQWLVRILFSPIGGNHE